jgi:prevent-host-death family protein
MTTIPATEAKNRFGELLEAIQRAPVEIAKKGRAVAVMISVGEYQDMKKRLGELEKSTDFSRLREWRENAARSRMDTATEVSDYHQHLDEKYGS